MAYRKPKRNRKRSHKHKHRNHSRSSLRRHNIQKKNEGKKENIPSNSTTWDADLSDISTYMENGREMIGQLFSSVGEDFFTKSVPPILKQATIEELKRICFEELTRMSDDIVFKVLEGIPCDTATNISREDCSKKRKYECKSSKNCCGHTTKMSSVEKCCIISTDPEEQELALSKGEDDDIPDVRNEAPSTSYQPSMTKKLAKVAPFRISMPNCEIPQPAVFDEGEGVDSSEIDNENSYEMVDLGLEEDIGGGEDESDSLGEVSMDEEALPHVSPLDENSDSQEMVEDMQQNFSEMLELEHRARAIRSMLANIDRFQAPSASSNDS